VVSQSTRGNYHPIDRIARDFTQLLISRLADNEQTMLYRRHVQEHNFPSLSPPRHYAYLLHFRLRNRHIRQR